MTDEPIVRIIASNVRRERTARRLSLSELARESGVNKGTLSQLEAGRGNPTIDTLFSLATALEVPLSSLVDNDSELDVQVVGPTEGTYVEVGIGSVRLIRRIAGPSVLELYELALEPNTYTESEPHAAGTVEHFLITEGSLTTGALDNPVRLNAGDYGVFRADHHHVYQTYDAGASGFLLIGYGSDVSVLLSGLRGQENSRD